MKATPALARALNELAENGSLAASRISSAVLKELTGLIEAGVLAWERKGSGRKVAVVDTNGLEHVIQRWFPHGLNAALARPDSRVEGVRNRRDAKTALRANTEPVLLRGRPGAVLCHNQEGLAVGNRHDGALDLDEMDFHGVLNVGRWTELAGYAAIELGTEHQWLFSGTIVVVENLEAFRQVEKVVPEMDMAVYAAGRASERLLAWLRVLAENGCPILHWGDYDPVGMDEFLRVWRASHMQAELVIPVGLEELFRRFGKPDLIQDNTAILARLRSCQHPEVAEVVNLMDQFGCGVEQEVMLEG